MKTTNTDGRLLPAFSADDILLLPYPDTTSQPFEIVLNVDTFNSLFRDLKKNLGIGDKKLTVSSLVYFEYLFD